MLAQEHDAVQLWLAMINIAPASAMIALRKIRDGKAEIVHGKPTDREPFTAAMCYDSKKLSEYLLHEFGGVAKNWMTSITPDATLLMLGVRLEQLLHKCADGEEAGELYSVLMEGPVPKGLRAKVDVGRLVITERRVEHLWRAMIIHSPQTVKEILEDIVAGRAFIGTSARILDRIRFQIADVWDDDKLSLFLDGVHDMPTTAELVNRYPPGETGDFHRTFMSFLYQHCTKNEVAKFHTMFFENEPSPEIEVGAIKPATDSAGFVEMNPTKISKTFEDFIECGKLLGIPASTLAILLPEETRQEIRMEILEDMLSKQ